MPLPQLAEAYAVLEAALNDPSKPWAPVFNYLNVKGGIKSTNSFFVMAAGIALYLIFGSLAQFICNLIGFAYPAYASLVAIESPQTDDDTKWLTYWTVYAFFSLVEYPVDLILYWFPFYWIAKCLIMIWLFFPGDFNGSLILYRSLIRPVFLERMAKKRTSIDNAQPSKKGR